jgi:PAS domain S-box-containing protein
MTHDVEIRKNGKMGSLTDASLLTALLQTSSDAIVVSDTDGRIVFWNPGAARIFGFDATDAMGKSLDLIIPENLRARHWQGFHRVMATGQSRYGDGDLLSVPALTKDGRRISVEFTIVMLHDEHGTAVGMASIMRDSTARFEEMKSLRRRIVELENGAPVTK